MPTRLRQGAPLPLQPQVPVPLHLPAQHFLSFWHLVPGGEQKPKAASTPAAPRAAAASPSAPTPSTLPRPRRESTAAHCRSSAKTRLSIGSLLSRQSARADYLQVPLSLFSLLVQHRALTGTGPRGVSTFGARPLFTQPQR